MGGVLVGGRLVPCDVDVYHVSCPRLVHPRTTKWVRQFILHKTIADDPEKVVGPKGPPGFESYTIEAWNKAGVDGAHAIGGLDGRVAQLADLLTEETYHATVSNAWSVGYEMKEMPKGEIYQATIDSAVKFTIAACRALGIQLQMPKLGSYTGHPIRRMQDGGPDMVGIFGHRDNTERRGKWDPGELVFKALAKAGVEQFDFAHNEDHDVWSMRQKALGLPADGVPGPGTLAALKKAGYKDGIFALGK
jgi:hypothetical protein